ncbi:MAG: hypothetical protein PHP42_03100 [Bacteroidota bacterium]|nr:hypothetical protein [Bacteroidota bacterium]
MEIIIWVAVPFVLLFTSSCKDNSNPVSKIEDIVFPAKNISYDRTIQPLFNIACANSACHSADAKASNLDLSSYYGTRFGKPGVVRPGDTLNSRLIWSIEARQGSVPMPPSQTLTLNQIRGLKIWIMEGATDSIH